LIAACGPEQLEVEAESTSSSGELHATGSDSEASSGDTEYDISWLVGKYTLSCAPYDSTQPPFVHGCLTDRSYELEFHADGTMTSTYVFCGMSSLQDEVGTFHSGTREGDALIEPAVGFDKVQIVGKSDSATATRTDDCMVVDLSYESAGGLNHHYFVRGEFQYVPQQGCTSEIAAISVPQCP